MAHGLILLLTGTLIVVVPTRDGIVISADSKLSRRTTAGAAAGVSAVEKVFSLPGVPDTAFFVTGNTPVEWLPDGGTPATIVDARGLVTARLRHGGRVTRGAFDAVAADAARIAARVHRLGTLAAPLAARDLFTVVMTRAGAGAAPHEVASFVIALTATGAEVRERTWDTFTTGDRARVMLFGEGTAVADGLARWSGGAAGCARQFLADGPRRVGDLDAAAAARGGYSVLEAASIAFGPDGPIGPPFRTYLLTATLAELRPPPPCR